MTTFPATPLLYTLTPWVDPVTQISWKWVVRGESGKWARYAPAETTASILAKLASGTGGVGEIGVEYLPDIWQEVWLAGGYTSPPPASGFTSVTPDAAWWNRVVNCDYDITVPFNAEEFLGERFVIRSTVEVNIYGAYIGDNSLFTIPAPIQQFGTTLTLIESIGGVWRVTLRYSERPANQETTASVLDKLKGATPAALPTKLGAEYSPDSLSGSVVPVAPLMRVTGTQLFNGDYAEYDVSEGKPTYTKSPYKIRWTGSQWQFETSSGPIGGGIISYDNVANPSLVIDWARTGLEDTGGIYVTPLAMAIAGKLAQYIGQLYHNTTTNKWYRWNGTVWQEDVSGTPIVTSVTAPTDVTVGWKDPETGIISYYIGGGWVVPASSDKGIDLGAGVEAALAKPIGANGSVQLFGEAMAPTSLIIPNMTGVIAPAGSLGLKGGALALADGVTPGGIAVGQRRFTGTGIADFGSQLKSLAFCKLVGIPILASEFIAGREFKLTGHLILRPVNSLFDNITNLVFGTTFNAGSLVPFINTSTTKSTNWGAKNYTLITSLNVYQPIRFDIVDGHRSFVGTGSGTTGVSAINYIRSPLGGLSSYYDADSEGEGEYFAAAEGVANTLWFMIQIESGNPGNHSVSFMEVHYDLTLEFTS